MKRVKFEAELCVGSQYFMIDALVTHYLHSLGAFGAF